MSTADGFDEPVAVQRGECFQVVAAGSAMAFLGIP
tara:strand:- start:334 stop:438 length:105 start_codon:yes stop_codon:yes gene_type:complete